MTCSGPRGRTAGWLTFRHSSRNCVIVTSGPFSARKLTKWCQFAWPVLARRFNLETTLSRFELDIDAKAANTNLATIRTTAAALCTRGSRGKCLAIPSGVGAHDRGRARQDTAEISYMPAIARLSNISTSGLCSQVLLRCLPLVRVSCYFYISFSLGRTWEGGSILRSPGPCKDRDR
ncbi:hypothetical protein VTK26DRAFT_5082 [Humicola hyalothermophila]